MPTASIPAAIAAVGSTIASGAAAAGSAIGGSLAAVGTAATGAAAGSTAATIAGAASLATAAEGLDGLVAGTGIKKPKTLSMPNPDDPALLNARRTQLALVQGRSGRASTNLSSGSSNYQATTAGGG